MICTVVTSRYAGLFEWNIMRALQAMFTSSCDTEITFVYIALLNDHKKGAVMKESEMNGSYPIIKRNNTKLKWYSTIFSSTLCWLLIRALVLKGCSFPFLKRNNYVPSLIHSLVAMCIFMDTSFCCLQNISSRYCKLAFSGISRCTLLFKNWILGLPEQFRANCNRFSK